jgi:ribosomal protein S2
MKLNYIKFTLNQLIISGLYIGNNHKLFRGYTKPYLLGRRGIIDVINLKFAYLELKVFLSFILNLSYYRQKYFIYLSGNFNIFNEIFHKSENLFFSGK